MQAHGISSYTDRGSGGVRAVFLPGDHFKEIIRKFGTVILLTVLILSGMAVQNAGAALAPGDLAVIGMNTDGVGNTDSFAIVALADIPGGEVIKITDRGIAGPSFITLFADGVIIWSPSNTVTAGTIIEISVTTTPSISTNPPAHAADMTISAGWSAITLGIFASTGDQVIIYQGPDDPIMAFFIYGFCNSNATTGSPSTIENWPSGTTVRDSDLPSGLINSDGSNIATAHAMNDTLHRDNYYYSGPTTGGDKNYFLTQIGINANWTGNDTTPYDISPGGAAFGTATFTIAGGNNPPTLSTFTGSIVAANEDTEVEITFDDLAAKGDENDSDGTVDAFVVKSVTTGTLKIGANSGAATAFAATTNDTIDAGNNAYWTPAADEYGTLNAFAVVAEDNDNAESTSPVTARVMVNPVNDRPDFTASDPSAVNEDAGAQTLAGWATFDAGPANEDGSQSVLQYIVSSIGNASLFSAGPAVSAAGVLTYTPAANEYGTSTFNLQVQDDGTTVSGGMDTSVTKTFTITVNEVNDPPTLTAFTAAIDSTFKDTEVEITMAELKVRGDEADIDGTVDAFVVKSVTTGTLRIGANSGAATAFAATTNDTINGSNNAYWTPALSATGTLNAFEVVVEDNNNAESTGNVTAQVAVTDNDIDHSIGVAPAVVPEGNSGSQTVTFTVTRTGATSGTSSVVYTIGTTPLIHATNGLDYNNIGGTSGATGVTGTINFAAGETSKTITMDVLGDTIDEYQLEEIEITLSAPSGGSGYDAFITGTNPVFTRITDDDVSMVINEADYDQGGTDSAEFIEIKNVNTTLSFDLSGYSVVLHNSDGTPYQVINTMTGNLAPGGYYVICDNASDVAACDLATGLGDDFIKDGSPNGISLVRNADNFQLDSVSYEGDVPLVLEGSPGGAGGDNGSDALVSMSRFPDGTDSNDNNSDFLPKCATPGGSNNITDGTGCFQIAISDPAAVAEGADGSTTSINFTVSLTHAATEAVTVNYATVNNTATSGDGDYDSKSGTVTFPAGSNANQIVSVTVNGDDVDESNETLYVNLGSPSANAVIIDNQGTGTITDDDTAGFTLSKATASVNESGTTDTFTVVLDSQPASDVEISVTSADTGEATVSATPALPLTFTPANWDTAQTVTVTGVDDAISDTNQTSTVTISVVDANSDDQYDPLADQTVTVTTVDNDTPGFAFNPASLTTTENGGTATFTVVLNTAPSDTVTLPLSSSNTTEGTVSPSSLTFTTTDWNNAAAHTVTVTIVDDDVDDGDVSYSIVTGDPTGTDTDYSGAANNPADVSVSNTDDDTAGVSIVQSGGSTSVNEQGATSDTYTVVLTSEPTADVTITPSFDSAQISVTPATLSFPTGDWDKAQTVTVKAVDDSDIEGSHTGTITHAATGGDYAGISVGSVAVNITDNDGVATVETSAAASVTANSAVLGGNVTDQGGSPVTERGVCWGTSSDPTTANSKKIIGSGTGAFSATVTGLEPGTYYYVRAYAINMAGPAYGTQITFKTGMVLPVVTTEAVSNVTATSATGGGHVTIEDGFSILGKGLCWDTATEPRITSDPHTDNGTALGDFTGQLTNLQPETLYYVRAYAQVKSGGLTYTVYGQQVTFTTPALSNAGFTIEPASGLITTEEGGTAIFKIKLNDKPTSDVTISLTSSDTGEGIVSPASLTFTPDNWDAFQTVAVKGVNDDLADGAQAYSITFGNAVSEDGNYHGLEPGDVSVSNTDDDTAGFTVSPISGNTSEDGTTATFTVRLNSKPSADVAVGVSSSDETEGTVSPANLTFTTENWNASQTVTVTGADDAEADGDQPYSIVLAPATSEDAGYNTLNPDDVSVANIDNEIAGFTVGDISGSTSEDGAVTTFTVRLNKAPVADVTVILTSSDSGEGAVSPKSLTFTAENWDADQTVTVTGQDDDIADGNQEYRIIMGEAESEDPDYSGMKPEDVTVTNTDNDSAGFVVGEISGSTSEDGTDAIFTVRLTTQPSSVVTITVSSSDTGEVTVSPESLIFTTENWNADQTVTVTGQDDDTQDGDQTVIIKLAPAVSDDPDYNGADPADVSVINTDNDTAGFVISAISGNTTEAGGKVTFAVRLTLQPVAEVTVQVSSSDTTEGTVSPATLTFTAENWNVPQALTVTGADDTVADGDRSYTVLLSEAVSNDENYSGVDPADVSVINEDNDTASQPSLGPPPFHDNHAPEAADLSVVTDENTAVEITLIGTDSDGDNLSFTVKTSPAHGTLSGNAPALTYTPDTDFTGSDSFEFRVSDSKGGSDMATVSITVNPISDTDDGSDTPDDSDTGDTDDTDDDGDTDDQDDTGDDTGNQGDTDDNTGSIVTYEPLDISHTYRDDGFTDDEGFLLHIILHDQTGLTTTITAPGGEQGIAPEFITGSGTEDDPYVWHYQWTPDKAYTGKYYAAPETGELYESPGEWEKWDTVYNVRFVFYGSGGTLLGTRTVTYTDYADTESNAEDTPSDQQAFEAVYEAETPYITEAEKVFDPAQGVKFTVMIRDTSGGYCPAVIGIPVIPNEYLFIDDTDTGGDNLGYAPETDTYAINPDKPEYKQLGTGQRLLARVTYYNFAGETVANGVTVELEVADGTYAGLPVRYNPLNNGTDRAADAPLITVQLLLNANAEACSIIKTLAEAHRLVTVMTDERGDSTDGFREEALSFEADEDGQVRLKLNHLTSVGVIVEDADGDLLPDDWETANGLNPGDPADANGDKDGDGMTNLAEFTANTDPAVANSSDDSDTDDTSDDSSDTPNSGSGGGSDGCFISASAGSPGTAPALLAALAGLLPLVGLIRSRFRE